MDHTALSNSMNEPCCIGPPKMEGSWWRVLKKRCLLEKGMANHFSILALRTPWTVWKRQKGRTLKDELPRSVGAQYGTADQCRNNSRKNEGMEPKQKQHPVVDGTGNRRTTSSTLEGNGKPLQYSCLENPMNSTKRQNDRVLTPGQWLPNMLLEIRGEVTPERMKGWSQSKNNTQLWMWLVIEARSDAVKSNIA